MNQYLAKAIEIYDANGINFQEHLAWHLSNGAVVSDYDCFGFYYFSHSSCIESSKTIQNSDTLFVTFYTGNIKKALSRFVNDFKFVAFSRDFQNSPKNRLHLISEFNKRITR